MSSEALPPLRTQAVKSAAWYGATRLWGQLLSWGITILLARVLVPDDYGLFAIALSVLTVLELLQEFGLGTAIIQRPDLTPGQLNGVFSVVATTSLLLTVLTFLAAGSISHFYAEPRLIWVLRILCLTFLLNSLGIVPYSLLTKALDLRHRSLAEAIATGASALVALWLAYVGAGVWALIYGHLARAIVLNAALVFFSRWVPTVDVTFKGMRSVISFGLRIVGTHLVGNSSPALTTFLLARLLGGGAVGLYAMAQSLAEAPHRISTAIINQVSFPVFSRLQNEREVLALYFLKISKYLAVVSLPIQAGLILVAPDLIPMLLSSKWEAMVAPFQIMCVESAVIGLTLTGTPLLTALGRGNLLFGRSLLSIGAMATATLIGAPFGLLGVVTARTIAVVPLRLTILIPCLRGLELSGAVYFRSMVAPLAATGLMATAVLTSRHAVAGYGGALERLVLSVAVGALIYLVTLLLLDRAIGGEVRTVARELFSIARP